MKIPRILWALPLLVGPASTACIVPSDLGFTTDGQVIPDAGMPGAEAFDAGIADVSLIEEPVVYVDSGVVPLDAGSPGSFLDSTMPFFPDDASYLDVFQNAEFDPEGGLDATFPFDF